MGRTEAINAAGKGARDSKPVPLPLNGSFFCCVDFGNVRYVAEQITLDVVEKESLGVRVREIEAVVIDDLGLFLQPAAPAWLADFRGDTLAELVWEGGECESRALLAAMCAFNCVRHFFL